MLSVIVPAYREGPRIHGALLELFEALDELERRCEVLVVSDGNTDETEQEARRAVSPCVRVFHYDDQRGEGFALCHGFSQAHGNLVAFVDADMELRAWFSTR